MNFFTFVKENIKDIALSRGFVKLGTRYDLGFNLLKKYIQVLFALFHHNDL